MTTIISLEEFKKLIEQASSTPDKVERINKLYQICFQQYKYFPDEVIVIAERIINQSVQFGYLEGQSLGNNILGLINKQNSNYEQAIVNFSYALKVISNTTNDFLKGLSMNNLGNIYERLGDYEKAMIFYSDAYINFEKSNDTKYMHISIHNMAVIYFDLKDYENALVEFKKVIDSKLSIKTPDLLLKSYFNTSLCYKQIKKYNPALEWAIKSYEFGKSIDNDYMAMRSGILISEILFLSGSYDAAEQKLNELINSVVELNNDNIMIYAYQIFGKIKQEKKEYEEAKKYNLIGLQLTKEHQHKKIEIEILLTLSEVFSLAGEYKNAYDYVNEYRLLNEELLNSERVKKVQQLQISNQIAQITREKELAEQSTLAKSNFLSNMSHEIRTPMNAILGFTDLLNSSTTLGKDEKNYVNTIKQSSDNLLHIINEILDFSKIEAGKIEFKNEPFNLETELKKVHQLFSLQASKKNLQLNIVIDPKLPPNMIGDSYRLNQVLVNLMGNAIKFTEQGMININAAALETVDNKIKVQFNIADTGIGIKQERLDQLFERFKQVSIETTYRYGGTGLGLAISKQLVELQDGSLGVESKENEGTTFSFSIPYLIMNELYLKDPSKFIEPNRVFTEPFRALVADDNPFNQLLIKKVFGKHFHNAVIESVENGTQVLSMLKRFKYDFILMDMRMPEMDGETTARKIRSMYYESFTNVPIVAFTAGVTDEDRKKAKDAGMHLFLPKPFTKEDLINLVAELGIISL